MPEEEFAEAPKSSRKSLGIVIVVIIVVVAFVAFMLWPKDGIDVPFVPTGKPVQMLIIGQPSVDLLTDLDNQRDLVYYRIKDASDLDAAPRELLAQYDIVLLDQHMGATPHEKSVSRALGEAIENYVKTGGKLIVVMDSGVYRSGGSYGRGVASDVIGWKVTFGDIIPVECDLAQNDRHTCVQPIVITGKVHRQDLDHRIMEGIEIAPADPSYGPLQMLTFDVKPAGNQIAYIKHAAMSTTYPAILEKQLLIGKSIYFNYDPAMTPGIWQNTLEYLR